MTVSHEFALRDAIGCIHRDMTARRPDVRRLLVALTLVSVMGCGDAAPASRTPRTAAPSPSTVTPAEDGLPTVGTKPGRPAARTGVDPPVRLGIDSIGVRAAVVPVGVDPDGSMEVPSAREVGWYRFGPVPGSPGSAVLAAHVDFDGVEGAFFRLREIAVGDPVEVTHEEGRSTTYAVSEVLQVPKAELDATLFARDGAPRLALITCGGDFDRSTSSYRDNVVAIAVPASDG